MGVSILISGNLTGFSRFYASDGANEIMTESRFKFDNYDYLMFLKPGGKVYSISFAPKHIAASIITPINDSFRRPGTMVISVLIPRNFKVESISGLNSKTALYDLLNELNNRFYEKNYSNGMVNQNPSVLMQDYYSDILARYDYVQDLQQKAISIGVDTDALTKKIGYITSAETDIPLYLASLCRVSYDGYHYIFISPDAPCNIDETPEEVAIYRVKITNKNMILPSPVKVTEQVYQLQPSEGEVDFNKNYTYKQVLAGECPHISAYLNGDILELTYKFGVQTKKINFVFYDIETNHIVDFSLIRPTITCNQITRQLSSESSIIEGSEISSLITLQSTGGRYHIIDTAFELKYVADGGVIRAGVSEGSYIQKIFNPPFDIPKIIKLTSLSGEQKVYSNITSLFNEKLSGQISDWSYEVIADGYEPAKGWLTSLADENYNFMMTPKTTGQQVATSSQTQQNSKKGDGNTIIFSTVQKSTKGPNWKKISILVGSLLLLTALAILIFKNKEEELVTRVIEVHIKDSENQALGMDYLSKHKISLGLANTDTLITSNGNIKYQFSGKIGEKIELSFKPIFNISEGEEIITLTTDSPKKISTSIQPQDTTIYIKLNVKKSELEDYHNGIDALKKYAGKKYKNNKTDLIKFYRKKVDEHNEEVNEEMKRQEEQEIKEIQDRLSAPDITFDQLDEIKEKNIARFDDCIKNLEEMFKLLRMGTWNNKDEFGYRPSTDKLSPKQKEKIEKMGRQWFTITRDNHKKLTNQNVFVIFHDVNSLDDWSEKAEKFKEKVDSLGFALKYEN